MTTWTLSAAVSARSVVSAAEMRCTPGKANRSLSETRRTLATLEGARGNPEVPKPIGQAVLLCDDVIREADTGKMTLVGIFDRVMGPAFPLSWTRPASVYARVTDAHGHYTFRLDLVDLERDQTIGRIELPFQLEDRIASHDLVFPMNGMRFERPGNYEFQLFADLRYVGGMRLYVLQVSQPQGGS